MTRFLSLCAGARFLPAFICSIRFLSAPCKFFFTGGKITEGTEGTQRDTENGNHKGGLRRKKPQISQIWCSLRACWRTQDCQEFGNRKGTTATKNREAPAGRRTGRRPSCPRSPSCPRPRRCPRRAGATGTTGTLNAPSPSSVLPLPSPSPAWRALARRGRAAGFRCAGYHKGSKHHKGHKVFWVACQARRGRAAGAGARGSLEAWKFGGLALSGKAWGVGTGTSGGRAAGAGGASPCRGSRGGAPCPSLSIPHFLFPLCALCVLRVLCDFQFSVPLCVSSVVSVVFFGVKKGPRPGGRGLFGVCAGVIRRRGFPRGSRRRGWR